MGDEGKEEGKPESVTKRRGRPPGARNRPKPAGKRRREMVETYAELEGFLNGFARGHIGLMILIGPWGVGKSRMLHDLLNGEACWIEGNTTAFGMYSAILKAEGPIVIDDVDALLQDKKCVALLKCLCQTEESRTVRWVSDAAYMERRGMPSSFETTFPVAIVANEWQSLSKNVFALEDRADIIEFYPTPQEIHAQAGKWFKDREIYEYFGRHLDAFSQLSFRLYIKAANRKKAGIDWKPLLGISESESREKLVLELQEIPELLTHEDRAREFIRRGGGSRSTYFNYRKRLGL